MTQQASTESSGVVVRKIQALRGPNLYAYRPVLKVELDIGPYEERPSDTFPGFVDRLLAWLPGLEAHECSVRRHGGFTERLRRGTGLAHICQHVTLELQGLMGFNVSFGRARSSGAVGVYNVLIQYEEEAPARAAFDTALRMTLAAMHALPFEVEAEIERLRSLADTHRLGPSTRAIVEAARQRRIPVRRLLPTGSLIQFGWGARQKRIRASQTALTRSIAVELCEEKPLTHRLLRSIGLPVPQGERVGSPDEAWRAAQALGLPVVLKPEDGTQGKGVTVNLRSEDEVRRAYEVASGYGDVLVERHIPGADYRLLVVNGRLVAAARRDPAQVVGDGRRTVRALVDEVNANPRRRPGHGGTLTRIRLDEGAERVLAQQGLSADAVPTLGRPVLLRQSGDLSTGGTATDVTDEVHPANARTAELAARMMGLDVAGVDMVCLDIRRPLAEQGGAIVEVNAAPGLGMHLHPAHGKPRDVGGPIVDMLYLPGTPARIPLISVTGTNGKTTVSRLLAQMFETAGFTAGLTCTDGIFLNRERIDGRDDTGDGSGPKREAMVLMHPAVEAAVLETDRGGILGEGLGFDRCSVGVVTNVSEDHLGQDGVETLEQLARVHQVVVEAVDKDGTAVLNAEDPLVVAMKEASAGHVFFFALREDAPVLQAHVAAGGGGVFVKDGWIVLARGHKRTPLVELRRVPFTHGGRFEFQVQNALAATAAAWAEGLPLGVIGQTLTCFDSSPSLTPGRFNRVELLGREIIVDRGHNAGAMRSLCQAVQALEKRRTVMVLGLPGDRRDDELRATAEKTLSFVDEHVLYDLAELRERAPAEVPRLIAGVLPDGAPHSIAANEREGFIEALRVSRPGDRIVLIADRVDDTLKMIEALRRQVEEASGVSVSTARERSVAL